MKLVLGSSSKYRKEEMENAGFVFDVMTSDVDELAIRHDDPYKLPLLLASAKADAIIPKITEPAILITADVVVVQNGRLFEKPSSRDEVIEWVKGYENNSLDIVTGVVIHNTHTGRRVNGVDISKVVWGPIDWEKLDEIIASGDLWNCAGGFNAQMVDLFGVLYDSQDRRRGVPIYLIRELVKKVE